MEILIKFRHGLGDAVQLTAVLNHLAHYHPRWQIDVAALPGKPSTFYGQCRDAFLLGHGGAVRSRYDRIFDLEWPECATCFADWPSTKMEQCLLDVFQLEPISEKCRYVVRRSQKAVHLAQRYMETVCKVAAGEDGRYPVALIHYQGNTSAEWKNLPDDMVRRLCDDVLAAGMVPVILDWDFRSPLPDGENVHCPHVDLELWGGSGTGDAQVLAALIEQASLMVGVDSGPLHVAGATGTPTIGVWTGHHPLHYFSHADNVTHLVPANHVELLRGDRQVGQRYFTQHYRYRTYDDLEAELRAAVRETMRPGGGLVFTRGFWIRANNAEQDLVIVKDIAEDDSYRIHELPMPRPVVVDVGAHIGTFSQSVHQWNPLARVFAVECCPENIPPLKKNVGDFATVIQAAATYRKDVALMSTVYPDCSSTGGTRVISRKVLKRQVAAGELLEAPGPGPDTEYWADLRPVRTVTLEDILDEYGLDRIDVLKLDCEGCEMSIIRDSPVLDRVGMIVGEYHDEPAFHEMVRQCLPDWHLRILQSGEPGIFWLTNKAWTTAPLEGLARCQDATPVGRASRPTPSAETADAPAEPAAANTAQSTTKAPAPSDWIFFYTPLHSGTHFVRFLLELHPSVSFWKCGTTEVDGQILNDWHRDCKEGRISLEELLRHAARCGEDLPGWTKQESARLGIAIRPKKVKKQLIHVHASAVEVQYPSAPTVITIRDPLLSVISNVRRGAVPEQTEPLIASFRVLATIDSDRCFWFKTDIWKDDRQKAFELMDYLRLEPTPEIRQFVARWPVVNETTGGPHERNFDPALLEARELAINKQGLHPVMEPWARKLRQTGIQPLLEKLGYQDLVWFE